MDENVLCRSSGAMNGRRNKSLTTNILIHEYMITGVSVHRYQLELNERISTKLWLNRCFTLK